MKLLAFLRQARRGGIVIVVVAGLLSGLASSLFVAMVNMALHKPDLELLAFGFAAVAFVRVTTNLFSQWYFVRFAQDSILALCDQLVHRVMETPFRTLERAGAARVMATLTDDVATLSAAFQAIPNVITNGAILLGCIIYLAWLSWMAALVLMGFGIIAALGYKVLTRRAAGPIAAARVERDTLFRHFRTLTEGIKELKMNGVRQHTFLDQDLVATAERVKVLNLSAMRHYLMADGWAQFMFFFIIGGMLLGMPALGHVPLESMTGYAFVALYAMAPIWGFIGTFPTFQRGETALARIESLGLAEQEPPADPANDVPRESDGASIEFRDVTFTYETINGVAGFTLGPINMSVHPGELVFLIGGNGSGKSTFVKLLTGLYVPTDGEIKINDRVVGPANRKSYREQFSTVFSDFFLFDSLTGTGAGPNVDTDAQAYLRLLGLDHKVRVTDGVLSTTALSQGQRRRLALLSAYLEDRPVYVFDEWAADQDPAYRQIFYSKFLPELKARGKTVVVITHDDRYFHLGDRIIELVYGELVDNGIPERIAERLSEHATVNLDAR